MLYDLNNISFLTIFLFARLMVLNAIMVVKTKPRRRELGNLVVYLTRHS